MSDVVDIPTQGEELDAPIPLLQPRQRRWRRGGRGDRPPKPRLRKLRLLLILSGLGALAAVSTVFGMMMAVASDLPQLENRQLYKHDLKNSYLYDDHWRPIGIFAPPNNVVIDSFPEISPWMRRSIVSIEDKRFWSDPGVDIRGIARAFLPTSRAALARAPRRSPSSSSRTRSPRRTTGRCSRSSARPPWHIT